MAWPGTPTRVFYMRAKGDERTTQVAVELREKDGSRWIAAITITPRLEPVLVPLSQFHYWKDNESRDRGGAGDQVRLSEVASLSVRVGAHAHARCGQWSPWHLARRHRNRQARTRSGSRRLCPGQHGRAGSGDGLAALQDVSGHELRTHANEPDAGSRAAAGMCSPRFCALPWPVHRELGSARGGDTGTSR